MINKFKQKNHNVSFLLFSLLIICSIVFFYQILKKNDGLNQNQNNLDHKVQASNTESNKSLESVVKKIPTMDVPILMYHHIRNMNDPNDQIGTNLSVSPADFANQLDLIKNDGYNTINFIDLVNNNLPQNPIILTFDDGYDNFYQNAYPILKSKEMTGVAYVISDFIGKSGYMTSDNLIELNKNKIEIGSHTLSHPDLTKIGGDRLNNEIVESKNKLEDILNTNIYSFCYPSGKYNSVVESKVKDAGYLFAVTTDGGKANTSDNFALKRYRVNRDTNISSYLKK